MFNLFSSFLFLLSINVLRINCLSSFSFANLIPTILNNGRWIEQNSTEINFVFNTSLPLVTKGSNCTEELHLFRRDFIDRKIWALKTFDAWGKIPSGVMEGNLFWIGSVGECRRRFRSFNGTLIEQPVLTRTCTIGHERTATEVRPIYGICVPQSCNASDIIDLINQGSILIPYRSSLTTDDVHCIESRPLDSVAHVTILLLVIILVLVLLATGMHMIYGRELKALKISIIPPTVGVLLWSRTTTSSNPTEPIQANDEREQSMGSDDVAPLVHRPIRVVDYYAQHLVHCFSLRKSYQMLVCETVPMNFACLNGIRVLSFCWLLLGHSLIFAAYYSDNVMIIFNWLDLIWFQLLLQTVFSVDSFFLLSGILTSFTHFISERGNEFFSLWKFLLYHYVYHYLRYTILYTVILLISISLSPYIAGGSPVYPQNGVESISCRHTWWRNLLYINNFFSLNDSCMPVTWFLAVLMQLHWITPFFFLIVSWKWLVGMLLSLIFILTDVISTAVIISKKNYDHGIFGDLQTNQTNLTDAYLNDVFIKPWCRLGPYALGLTIGYILYEVYTRSNVVAWSSLAPHLKVHSRSYYIKQLIVWTIALTLLSLCIFGFYGEFHGHTITRAGRIAFLTLSRLTWSVALTILIVTCFVGYGGFVNRWLSQSYFSKLSKLTYGAFLWHTLIVFVFYFSRDQPTHLSIGNLFFDWICLIILSYSFSLITALLLEFPIVQLLKFSLKSLNMNSANWVLFSLH